MIVIEDNHLEEKQKQKEEKDNCFNISIKDFLFIDLPIGFVCGKNVCRNKPGQVDENIKNDRNVVETDRTKSFQIAKSKNEIKVQDKHVAYCRNQ